jgi:hypothetical protein
MSGIPNHDSRSSYGAVRSASKHLHEQKAELCRYNGGPNELFIFHSPTDDTPKYCIRKAWYVDLLYINHTRIIILVVYVSW